MTYQHVIVAVDISDEAEQVLEQARRVAGEHGARLSVMTVVKPLTQVYGGLDMTAYARVSVNFEQEAETQARKRALELAAAAGVRPEDVHVATGSPAGQIVATATACNADLIVVGSHGKHGLGLLLGSTANGVLHQAECDVLTIRISQSG